MERLLPYFERELVILRRYCHEFSERFPRIAGKLHMAGDVCEDPHIERLIESVALLAARISKRLDDDPQCCRCSSDEAGARRTMTATPCQMMAMARATGRGRRRACFN